MDDIISQHTVPWTNSGSELCASHHNIPRLPSPMLEDCRRVSPPHMEGKMFQGSLSGHQFVDIAGPLSDVLPMSVRLTSLALPVSSVRVGPASSRLMSFFGTLVLRPTAAIDVRADAGPVFGQVHQYRYGVRFAQHRHAVGCRHHFLLYSITMKAARMAAMTAAAAHAATVAVSSSSAS